MYEEGRATPDHCGHQSGGHPLAPGGGGCLVDSAGGCIGRLVKQLEHRVPGVAVGVGRERVDRGLELGREALKGVHGNGAGEFAGFAAPYAVGDHEHAELLRGKE